MLSPSYELYDVKESTLIYTSEKHRLVVAAVRRPGDKLYVVTVIPVSNLESLVSRRIRRAGGYRSIEELVEGRIIEYDPGSDILVIRIRRGKAVDGEWLDNDVVLLYGEDGRLLEVEVHRARGRGLVEAVLELSERLGLRPMRRAAEASHVEAT
ncbi:DUF2283 domain-containing protein [Pyrodictium abyssi]|uniref:Uncharacterized protein n=1 Tax=Pyrodictium abyssi TaxID=54256 RepID=A0ABM8IW28_9CREN|nr:hypothetical protein PABY_13310 [Pyrodictium abyssi]